MSGDQIVSFIWFGAAMVLVVSGLAARRLPIGRTVGMAAAWLGIFVAAALLARMLA